MSEVRTRALIMVVSRTDTIERAVEEFEPEMVGVILSQDILGPIVAKCTELEPRTRFLYRIVDSPMEISHSFERFEHLLFELGSTGLRSRGCHPGRHRRHHPDAFRRRPCRHDPGMRMVHQRVPQTLRGRRVEAGPLRDNAEIVPMDNPLESTGLLREGQAVELFNRRDYAAAALVFEDVAKKVTGVERGHYYKGLLLLSEGYAAWDVADYGTALEKLRVGERRTGRGFFGERLSRRRRTGSQAA